MTTTTNDVVNAIDVVDDDDTHHSPTGLFIVWNHIIIIIQYYLMVLGLVPKLSLCVQKDLVHTLPHLWKTRQWSPSFNGLKGLDLSYLHPLWHFDTRNGKWALNT